jgi:ABC-type phosphate/phosphonate transport system substrate-binding protein
VVRDDLDPAVSARLREVFLSMGEDPTARMLLAPYQVTGFVARADADFDVVREMRRRGRGLAGSPAAFGQ